jgi:hypothetical protein
MAKKPRLLKWSRTWPDGSRDDYLGKHPDHPRLYARTYHAVNFDTPTPWFWVLAEKGNIGAGYEATVEAAVDAAERAYAAWRDFKPAR